MPGGHWSSCCLPKRDRRRSRPTEGLPEVLGRPELWWYNGRWFPMRHKPMAKQYVEKLDDVYRLVGTSVSLDSIVHAFWRGQTVESIAQSFPVLMLEQVYGALTFYLAHQAEVDTYLEQADVEIEAMRRAARDQDPMFYQKLADARRRAA